MMIINDIAAEKQIAAAIESITIHMINNYSQSSVGVRYSYGAGCYCSGQCLLLVTLITVSC